ncbi:11406_t:CDS:2 [Paraglomus brasilianum]|uniref:11406_t:CDS:1 n=1 Tax=Paraglomus brasilianum TaxID=144538 RepID=A0A9N9GF22_9GLOM|nr:11406_t:CDS:2 [Paraglomus brasilianum]
MPVAWSLNSNPFDSLPAEVMEFIFHSVVSEYDRHSCEFYIQGPRKRQLMRMSLACKLFAGISLRQLWETIFDGDFKLEIFKSLLKSLPLDARRELGIHELLPENSYAPYSEFVRSVSLEKLFYYIDEWLEQVPQSSPITNTPDMQRKIVHAIFKQFMTNGRPLEKLRSVGFHENLNYRVILDEFFSSWIKDIHILVIRGSYDITPLVSRLAERCTTITPFARNMRSALKLIQAQTKLQSLIWNGIHGKQRIDGSFVFEDIIENVEENSDILGNDPTEILSALPAHAHTLTYLRIANMDFKKVQSLEDLAACRNLETIAFIHCTNINNEAIQPMMDQIFTKLRMVELSYCTNFNAMEEFARMRGVLRKKWNRDIMALWT